MMHWLYTEFTKLSTVFIIFTQWIVHWEDIVDRFAGWLKLSHLIERRKHMGIIDEGKLLLEFVPKVEKIIADAKAADQSPAGQQLIIDIEALVNEVKTAVATPPPPAPPAAA